ncbi:radical SAM protein [Hyperthermus butylicus]|uniref:Conserved archaeal protein n=1 Tax=Hyperthermus butylicus (strain DSM 5456 / JCM 9403 / PLM1-5) TaxID=415426 RepID=A2BMK9_HYPBU|nr:radical SAM protein [Hyperthermus butylicus]ABM81220.1 conserved archaeal protein [Hyperthermus butylicus DSM 5456]
MVEWLEFVIKPSNYISSLCYSILRLEPFTTCSYGCVYCYARWYRGPHGKSQAKPWLPKLFEKLAQRLREPKPFFRLATLSDPLQPPRGPFHPVIKRLLRIALRHKVPIVLNTKGDPRRDPELESLLLALADHGLLIVQLTIPYSSRVAVLLEPGAPPVEARLEALEHLVGHRVPVVVRVQPLIPGLEEEHLWAAEEALERGARGVIGEPLRETREGLERLYKLLGMDWRRWNWEPYQLGEEPGREPLLHPTSPWRLQMHTALAALAARYGAVYSACKDTLRPDAPGLTRWYQPGKTCCLEWLGFRRPVAVRPTLHEYHYLSSARGESLSWTEFMDKACGIGLACSGSLEGQPSWIRKAYRVHENKLRRIVEGGALQKLLGKLADTEQPGGGGMTRDRPPTRKGGEERFPTDPMESDELVLDELELGRTIQLLYDAFASIMDAAGSLSPYVPTSSDIVDTILDLVEAMAAARAGNRQPIYYEPGCGTATVAAKAAERGMHTICLELDETLAVEAHRRLRDNPLAHTVVSDLAVFRPRRADTAYAYLLPRAVAKLLEALKGLGASIISLDYPAENDPDKVLELATIQIDNRRLHIYKA